MGKHQPALLGGLLIGVLSATPFVNLANCCCLWVIGGGMFTVYLQQQRTPVPVETADAVLGGLLAGLVGGVLFAVLNSVVMSMTGAVWQDDIRRALDSNPEMPAEARDFMLRLISGGGVMILFLAVVVPLFAVFSMLGSLIGLAIFRKQVPPAAPQDPQGPEVMQG